MRGIPGTAFDRGSLLLPRVVGGGAYGCTGIAFGAVPGHWVIKEYTYCHWLPPHVPEVLRRQWPDACSEGCRSGGACRKRRQRR